MRGRSATAVLAGTAILLTSKGFVDYSVSGLENPATHLAVAAYVWVYWRGRDPFWLTFIASLAAVNRMDSILLFVPSLLWVYFQVGWRVWKNVLLGSIPFLAWEAFALFYFGFPFPNTAYAKLNTGNPPLGMAIQGIHYLQATIAWDTVTALAIAAGVAVGFLRGDWPLALGALLSVTYVVRIGGDYMLSRFLTPVFVLCCAILIQHAPRRKVEAWALAAAALLFGMLIPSPTLLTGPNFGVNTGPAPEFFGIGDERMSWYAASGLLRWKPDSKWPNHSWREDGLKIRASGSKFADLMPVGMIPYFAGPDVYVYDRGALGDAFTAHIPFHVAPTRPGHYWRVPPPGYLETLKTGVNSIQDKNLAEYYDHLRHIIRGGLWDPSRWREILEMNLGMYNNLLLQSSIDK